MNYYIYKYVNEKNEINYIGQTTDLKQRILAHYQDEYGKEKIYYFECENKMQMSVYEYLLIKKYTPYFNKQFNNEQLKNEIIFTLQEPQWIDYSDFPIEKEYGFSHNEYLQQNKFYRSKETLRKGGASRVELNKNDFLLVNNLYEQGQIDVFEAANRLNIGRTTFLKIRRSANTFFNDNTITIKRRKYTKNEN